MTFTASEISDTLTDAVRSIARDNGRFGTVLILSTGLGIDWLELAVICDRAASSLRAGSRASDLCCQWADRCRDEMSRERMRQSGRV